MTTDIETRSAREVLDSCRVRVEPALRAVVDGLPDMVRHLCGYHMGWWDDEGRPVTAGGKAIRPAVTVVTAAAVAGRDPDLAEQAAGAALPAAVAVELVHNFSLLHDDVMDQDLTRRHRPTVWALFGEGPAILAGDALLTLGMDVIVGSGQTWSGSAATMLSAAVQELVDGQIADLAFERRDNVTLDECLHMAEGKTGALLGAACALGALSAGAPAQHVADLDRVGRDLGLAFQMVDDLLGIWGDPDTTGKPVRADLRARKKSLPVVAAMTSGTPAGAELNEIYHRDRDPSDTELERAAQLVVDSGARAWCRRRADELGTGARGRLTELVATDNTGCTASADLRTLAGLITHRDH